MKRIFCFNYLYFLLTIILFVVEILIALYVNDSVIRPYGGDLLVVILIYCFLRSFVRIPVFVAAIAVLLFSFLVEALQYFAIVEKLGWGHSAFARTVIGTSFSWTDIIAYTLGILVVLIVEIRAGKKLFRT